jgi:hypothetical protein
MRRPLRTAVTKAALFLGEGRGTNGSNTTLASGSGLNVPAARLAELLHEVERQRSAIREYGLAGYVTKVEQHKARLRGVYEQIRAHCSEHGLELPAEVPTR